MLKTSRFQENQTVVCSDSTLCHLWRVSTFIPVFPVNFDCVVGGTVIDVHKMFLDQYRNCDSILNVIANDDNKMKKIMIIKITKMMTLRGRAQYPTPGQFN